MNDMNKSTSGFTIVELLIVIVVIALLATISAVAFTGIQERSREARRASDFNGILKALRMYEVKNGGVPRTVGVGAYTNGETAGGWDHSASPYWLAFLRPDHGNMPVDPLNTRAVPANAPDLRNRVYYYFCYTAGSGSLPTNPTDYVVVGYLKENSQRIQESFSVDACL